MNKIKIHTVGIIMNGVTGRMGTNQHLLRSIVAIIKQGGLEIGDSEVIMPNPILVGRNPAKLEELSQLSGVEKWTTNLENALSDSAYPVYFDSQTTSMRVDSIQKAIAAGKHIYCEKPTATTTEEAYHLYQLASKTKLKNGVVQDKLWLPGMKKLERLIEKGTLGRILSVRGGIWILGF